MFATVPMDQGKRKLSETVLVHFTDVRVLLEILCGETKLEFGIVRCGKGFPKCTFILIVNFNHTLHHLSHRLIFFRMEMAERSFRNLLVCMPN